MSGRIYPPLEALYDADQLEGIMAGQKAPCPVCGAPLAQWGEGRCITCDVRMTPVKDCDRLLELAVAFQVALTVEAKAWGIPDHDITPVLRAALYEAGLLATGVSDTGISDLDPDQAVELLADRLRLVAGDVADAAELVGLDDDYIARGLKAGALGIIEDTAGRYP